VLKAGTHSEEFRTSPDVHAGPPKTHGFVRDRGSSGGLPQASFCGITWQNNAIDLSSKNKNNIFLISQIAYNSLIKHLTFN